MDSAWGAVGALLALIVPLAVAWWLIARGERPSRRRGGDDDEREKMKR